MAFVSALYYGRPAPVADFIPKEAYSPVGIIFLIALMGWMPTAVDISTWTSLWAEAKIKDTGYRPTIKESSFDFNLGYWTSAILAICFLTLGATVIYGSGTELSNSSPTFASQLISLFTGTIGDWSYYIIAIAALSTMFSTTITVVDGYGRAVSRTMKLFFQGKETKTNYGIWIFVTCLGAFFIISRYLNNLKQLVDLATILSFVVAPLAGYLNLRVIYSNEIEEKYRPPRWLRNLAIAGLVFLFVFTGIYFYVLLKF